MSASHRRSVRVGQTLHITRGSSDAAGIEATVTTYRVEEIGPTEALLVAIDSAKPPVAMNISYLLASPDVTWLGDSTRGLASRMPDDELLRSLPSKQAAKVERKLHWVRRIGESRSWPSGGDKVTTSQLVAQAAADLGITPRTLFRYEAAYEESGVAGLLDKRKTHAGAPIKASPEMFTLIANYLHANRDRKLTETGQLREIRAELRLANHTFNEVSDSTLRTYLKYAKASLGYEDSPKARLHRKRTATKPSTPYTPAAFGEVLQMDEHILDIEVFDPLTGRIGRPRLHVLFETTISVPVSMKLSLAPLTAVDAGFLLHDSLMFTRPETCGDTGAVAITNLWDLPADVSAILDKASTLSRRPLYVSVPRAIRTDNASIYTASDFVTAATSLGISVIPARPYKPTDKAHLERFFGTLESTLIQHLPGAVGSKPQHRPTGKMGPTAPLLSLPALEQVIFYYMHEVWMDQPRPNMEPLCRPGEEISPRDALHMQMQRTGFVDGLVDPHAALALLPGTYAALSNTMITVKGLRYSSPELGYLRDTPTPDLAHKGKYHVRYDPRDLSGVWVFLPESSDAQSGRWTYARCRSISSGLPFSVADLEAATRRQQEMGNTRSREEILQDFLTRVYSGEALDAAEKQAASLWADRITRAAIDHQTHLPPREPVTGTEKAALDDPEEGISTSPVPTPFEDHVSSWIWSQGRPMDGSSTNPGGGER